MENPRMSPILDDFIAPKCLDEIALLYQDEHILLINKPSGLLSLSGKNPLNLDSVHYRLRKNFPGVCMVHRLDFGTSGIMLLAMNKAMNALLTKQFQDRTIFKTYTSILMGALKNGRGTIDMPIAKDKPNFPLQKICYSEGKAALSHYEVIERWSKPARTKVIFRPETGRTHQLRIHSQAIGHPILGCDLYGTKETKLMAERMLLHATSLEFTHPFTGKAMRVECPCPF